MSDVYGDEYTVVALVSPGMMFSNELSAENEARLRSTLNPGVRFIVVRRVLSVETSKTGTTMVAR